MGYRCKYGVVCIEVWGFGSLIYLGNVNRRMDTPQSSIVNKERVLVLSNEFCSN